MRIELIDTFGNLIKIRRRWEKLLCHCQVEDFFLLPQWLFSWWKVFGEGGKLFFVAFWEKEELLGLFPLYKVKKGPFKVITFAGRPTDRMDILLAKDHEQSCIKLFSEWLFSKADWDLLSLRNFGCFSKNPELFDRILAKEGEKCILTTEEPGFFISTRDFKGFENYIETVRSAKSRSILRGKRKRVMKYTGSEWKVLNHIDLDLLDEMEELDLKRSNRGSIGQSFFSNPLNKIFLEKVLEQLQKEDMIKIFIFRTGGKLCAYELTFKFRDKILFYQTSFDEIFHKDSIGILTILEAVKYVFDNRYEECDFLMGAEAYKTDWAKSYRQCRRLLVYRGGVKSSILYLYHKNVKPVRRKLKDHVQIKRILPKKMKIWDI